MAVAIATKHWTLEEVLRLPDDGNRYELVRGELFVTPPPGGSHETIGAKLTRLLDPFVEKHALGYVYHPRSVMRFEGSQVEPDLMVRLPHPMPVQKDVDWDTWPLPVLVVEISSGYTWKRDRDAKKALYLDAGVAEYWVVDREREEIIVYRAGEPPTVERDVLTWRPPGAAESLAIQLAPLFDGAR